MTLREEIISHLLSLNKRKPMHLDILQNKTDTELLEELRVIWYSEGFNDGYTQCCNDNPDNDNVSYLT